MASKRLTVEANDGEVGESSGSGIGRDSTFPTVIFTSEAQKVRFHSLKSRPLIPTRFICRTTMRALGLDGEGKKLFDGFGMGGFYTIQRSTFARITWEFLSSLEVIKNKNTRFISKITFRLINQDVEMILKDFGKNFGVAYTQQYTPPERFNRGELWQAITGIGYGNSDHHSSINIHSIVIRIWHRFMGWTVFGRHEPHNVRFEEINILGTYLRQAPTPFSINVAHHLVLYLQKVGRSANAKIPVVVGGLITHIAKAITRFDERRHEPVSGYILLNTSYLTSSLEWIRFKESDRKTYLMIGRKTSIALPNVPAIKLVPDQASYLLPIAAEDPSAVPPLRTYRRETQEPTPSSFEYVMPSTSASTSTTPQQYQPLHPDLVKWMANMDLGVGGINTTLRDFKEQYDKDMEGVHNRIDRVYADQALGMYPIYDDYASRGCVPPNGPFPSYYSWPDGGYSAPGTHGEFTLRQDYFSTPTFGVPGQYEYTGGWYGNRQEDGGASGSGAPLNFEQMNVDLGQGEPSTFTEQGGFDTQPASMEQTLFGEKGLFGDPSPLGTQDGGDQSRDYD